MKHYPFLVALFFLIQCTGGPIEDQETPKRTVNAQDDIDKSSTMVSIDLSALEDAGQLPPAQDIAVEKDIVLGQAKNYLAYPLREILQPYMDKMGLSDTSKALVTFICKDGYKPNRYLRELLPYEVFVAFKDKDAAEGKNWLDSLSATFSPYYLVWKTSPEDKKAATWPYGLEKIQLNTVDTVFNSIYPSEDLALVAGFEHFKYHCLKCHALNKVGGTLGPEFNFPKNILEYWSVEDVWQFAKDPTSYRHNAKMYAMEDLTREEFDEIVKYLEYMKEHKLAEN